MNSDRFKEQILQILLDKIQTGKHVKNYPYRLPVFGKPEAADEIVELFAHLASEAKPGKPIWTGQETPETDAYKGGYSKAIDTYEQNILKALGREKENNNSAKFTMDGESKITEALGWET